MKITKNAECIDEEWRIRAVKYRFLKTQQLFFCQL